jgi:hypothetical protein
MKLNHADALEKIRAHKSSGEEPVRAALAAEQSNVRTRPSHSKGRASAIVTGYLEPVHVDVLVNLRSRLGASALSVPSTNQLLRVALRLVRDLEPSNAQIMAAYLKEKT